MQSHCKNFSFLTSTRLAAMAVIVDALASQFKETLTALIKDEIIKTIGAKEELKRLQGKLGPLHHFLVVAEQKGLGSPPIRAWLAKLRDLIYDADDVVDYYRTIAERIAGPLPLDQPPPPPSCFPPVGACFRKLALRRQVGGRIRGINARLDELIKEKNDLEISVTHRDDDHGGSTSTSSKVHRPPADSLAEQVIVGAGVEVATREMVEQLTAAAVDGPPVSVHAIVGMGGIGKTTLTQMIFNHKSIKDAFQSLPPMWASVSKECSETALLKDIIRQASGGEGQTTEQLHDVVAGKKFFLVLDDVWDARIWTDLLRKPLQSGAAGSRILVTTRNEQVAKDMRAVSVRQVQPLSLYDSWSLVTKMVFDGGEEGEIELLKDVGLEIVAKCEGLPLAVTTIAGVLGSKPKRRREWEMVRDNPAWSATDLPDGVMAELYLSYEDLPFNLKQCFVFCSLFPEDYVFTRHAIIQHWVAQGFVAAAPGAIMEEIGRGYYQELLRRSLVQRDPRIYDDAAFTMHDLVRSLARFLAQHDTFAGDGNALAEAATSSSSSGTKLRHLSFVDFMAEEFPATIKEHESLRTLFVHIFMCMAPPPDDLFEKLGRLRVLDFRGTSIGNLPASVGNLIHLRYLDISGSMLKELPDTVGDLSNLQFLILQGCEELKRLPKGIARLYKIRCLDLIGTPVDGMPVGIGRLRLMSRLAGFVTNESGAEWCSLEELRSLSELRDLTLDKLERAAIASEGRGSILNDMTHLRGLKFRCTKHGQHHGEEEQRRIKKVFEELLCPPNSVEKFEIEGYSGLEYPSWMMGSEAATLFANVRRLELRNCKNCTHLPPLGLLPRLDHISVKDASAVQIIGPELMGWDREHTHRPAFPMLKSLKLNGLHNWTEWRWEAVDGAEAMARLEKLELKDCPNLKSLPDGILRHSAALSWMKVEGAYSLQAIENLPSLKELIVVQNQNLTKISDLPTLEILRIFACPAVRNVEHVHALQALEMLDLQMEALPEWLLPSGGPGEKPPFPALQALYITVSRADVLRRCLVDHPDWPKIQQFPHAYIQCQPQQLFDEFGRPLFVFYVRDPPTFNSNLEATDGDREHADA